MNWSVGPARAYRTSTSTSESLLWVIGCSSDLDNSEPRQLRLLLGALRHVGSEHKREGSQQMGRGTQSVRIAQRASATTGAAVAAPPQVSSATRRAAGKTSIGRLFRRSSTFRHGVETNLINTHGRVE